MVSRFERLLFLYVVQGVLSFFFRQSLYTESDAEDKKSRFAEAAETAPGINQNKAADENKHQTE